MTTYTRVGFVMKRFSIWLLEKAERFFLRAHGWRITDNGWEPPADYEFRNKRRYTRSHAVNASKQLVYNPMFKGKRQDI